MAGLKLITENIRLENKNKELLGENAELRKIILDVISHGGNIKIHHDVDGDYFGCRFCTGIWKAGSVERHIHNCPIERFSKLHKGSK